MACRCVTGGDSPEHSNVGQPAGFRQVSCTHVAVEVQVGCGCATRLSKDRGREGLRNLVSYTCACAVGYC